MHVFQFPLLFDANTTDIWAFIYRDRLLYNPRVPSESSTLLGESWSLSSDI